MTFPSSPPAPESVILVVNHALLLTDIQAGGRVLPPFNHLIVDEAHRLEEAATDQLTYRTDWNAVAVWLGILGQDGSLARLLTEACTSAEDTDSLRRLARIDSLARKTADKIQLFTGRLLHFVRNQEAIRTDSQYTQRIALDRALRSQPAWSELEIEWDTVNSSLHALLHELDHLVEALDDKQWRQKEPFSSYLAELAGVAHDLGELDAHMEQIIYSPGDSRRESVAWAELDEPSGNAAMVSAPLFVSDVIERELIHKKRSVILTGATLRTGSGFAFIRDRLACGMSSLNRRQPLHCRQHAALHAFRHAGRDGQCSKRPTSHHLAALATGGSLALFQLRPVSRRTPFAPP